MSESSSAPLAQTVALALHQRLLDGDPVARSDLACAYLDWLAEAASGDEAIGPAVRRLVELHAELSQAASHSAAPEALEQIIIRTDAAHADLLPARQRATNSSLAKRAVISCDALLACA